VERIVRTPDAGSGPRCPSIHNPCQIPACDATVCTVDPLHVKGRQEVMSIMKSVNVQSRVPLAHLRSPETQLHGSDLDLRWVLDKILERPDAREIVDELAARLRRSPLLSGQQRLMPRPRARFTQVAPSYRRAS